MSLPKYKRNQPCPCGSARKYKKCCLPRHSQIRTDAFRSTHPNPVFAELKIREDLYCQQRRQFGETRPIIHMENGSDKVVAVGDELHVSSQWKTFPDFLLYYIKHVFLAPEWLESELAREPGERHPVIAWHTATQDLRRKKQPRMGGIYPVHTAGPMKAYLSLAYELYTLRHHELLQGRLIERMKRCDQFQGARYELFATATCIRAGFDIAFEDEADSSKKHPEFRATHRKTGELIAVEAKSRHRPGILAHPGKPLPYDDVKPDIGPLLTRAFKKFGTLPYVIFVDLNMPPGSVLCGEERFHLQMRGRVNRVARNFLAEFDPYSLILITNHPYHFGMASEPAPQKTVFAVLPENPKVMAKSDSLYLDILQAAHSFDKIPNAFPG